MTINNPTSSPTVDNLMKVSLNLEIDPAAPGHGPVPRFEFIYGVGPAGITSFEKALFGKRVGERVRIDLSSEGYAETVGHLEWPLREQTGITAAASLRATITDIAKAPDRDVIKAMAAGGSCGDCGCGCGGHSRTGRLSGRHRYKLDEPLTSHFRRVRKRAEIKAC